jgi:hypothetical protein
LISANIESGESIVGLTDYGISVCGSVMYNRINENSKLFWQRIIELPERVVACFVNRILWKDIVSKENGFIDLITESYTFYENLWYERVLLRDERIGKNLEKFYSILENLGFIENIDGQRWCSSEVEKFLKKEYKKIMDLTWNEEDSLKYYFYFNLYAQDQKNIINFSGDGEQYRSMFYEENINPIDYLYSTNESDSVSLLSSLGLSEKRIIDFFEEMQHNKFVNERYYPLSSSKFFSDDEKIYVIKDIKGYMDYIKSKFLIPVVDSLIS